MTMMPNLYNELIHQNNVGVLFFAKGDLSKAHRCFQIALSNTRAMYTVPRCSVSPDATIASTTGIAGSKTKLQPGEETVLGSSSSSRSIAAVDDVSKQPQNNFKHQQMLLKHLQSHPSSPIPILKEKFASQLSSCPARGHTQQEQQEQPQRDGFMLLETSILLFNLGVTHVAKMKQIKSISAAAAAAKTSPTKSSLSLQVSKQQADLLITSQALLVRSLELFRFSLAILTQMETISSNKDIDDWTTTALLSPPAAGTTRRDQANVFVVGSLQRCVKILVLKHLSRLFLQQGQLDQAQEANKRLLYTIVQDQQQLNDESLGTKTTGETESSVATAA